MKPIWQTKVFWLGVLAILGGIVEGVFDGWQQGIDKVLLGATMIGGKHAIDSAKAEAK